MVTVQTLAGSHKGPRRTADGPASDARFSCPCGVAIDAEGNVIVADAGNSCIHKVAPDGTVSTLAGSREQGRGFADGPAGDARFSFPRGVAIDAEGNVIVADAGNHCIRKVAPDGTVSTLAGSREQEDGFADGPAGDARFSRPSGVAIDAEGNVIVADAGNHCIRKLANCALGRGISLPRWHVGTGSTASDFLRMLEDVESSDVTFEVEGTRITAHRAVLIFRSQFFRSMLKSGCREAEHGAVIRIGK